MRVLTDEREVHGLEDSPHKKEMLARIFGAHAIIPDAVFDAVADCGGAFYLMEEGDDLRAVHPYSDDWAIDLTDLDGICYEFVACSEDETTFILFLATGDEGGLSFFIPNVPWLDDGFRRALLQACPVGEHNH